MEDHMARKTEPKEQTDTPKVVTDHHGNRLVPDPTSEGRFTLYAPGDELPFDEDVQRAIDDHDVHVQFPPTSERSDIRQPQEIVKLPAPEDQLRTQPTSE
jgi:hypothetical protein